MTKLVVNLSMNIAVRNETNELPQLLPQFMEIHIDIIYR